ncbi:MAG: branched-chain amino acid transport system ATP-binding protein [Acidimicrobiaceae bacterium]|jgi:branched-chain amino acid transport system ATP-binding protein|nr:branched-chain amino acid transport system ATP-binding protein [Acidimicrobiaceae bacterium]
MNVSAEPLLALRNVEVRYPGGGAPAVTSASFALSPGEIAVVVGSNGAGKTSLVRAIAGFLPSEGVTTRGSIRLAGREIRGKNPARLARSGLCFIPERNKVFRGLSVDQNLKLFGARRRSAGGLDDDLRLVFEMFPWMAERRGVLAGYLSGGEQQMLALSGAVLARPDLVIVDEPSLGLAPVIVQQVMQRLKMIRNEFGASILLVDQNVSGTVVIADRVFAMHVGDLVEEDTTEVLRRAKAGGYARTEVQS